MFWSHPGIGPFIDTLTESAGRVDYPQPSFARFHQLQKKNLAERESLTAKISDELKSLKIDFFKSHHYGIDSDTQGNSKVILDGRGNPTWSAASGETEFHRSARELYESGERRVLIERHQSQSTSLVQRSADTVREFLLQNSGSLSERATHEKLRDVIKKIRLDALGLQQRQQWELHLIELPSSDPIRNRVAARREALCQMEKDHLESELKSDDMHTLLSEQSQSSPSISPVRPFAPKSGPPQIKIDDVLPADLSRVIFQLGIYQL